MNNWLQNVFIISLFIISIAIFCALIRLLIGPRVQDRILALDCIYLNSMLFMLILGMNYESTMYFEAALLISLFGCVGSIVMAKFLLRGEAIE